MINFEPITNIIDPTIPAHGLIKIYKTRTIRLKALNGVDLDIMPNEFLAIVSTSRSENFDSDQIRTIRIWRII